MCDPDAGVGCPEGFDCTPIPQIDGHLCLKSFIPIWPVADDPPGAAELIAEVVEEPGEDLLEGEIHADGRAPAADSRAPGDAATADAAPGGGGRGGCAAGPASPAPAMVIPLLPALVRLRRRSSGCPG